MGGNVHYGFRIVYLCNNYKSHTINIVSSHEFNSFPREISLFKVGNKALGKAILMKTCQILASIKNVIRKQNRCASA